MEREELKIQTIVLEWTDWIPWNDLKLDARSGGFNIPNHISGVYEAKHENSNERMTIGKATDLRMRVKHGLVKGKIPHSAGERIRANEDVSKIVIRWAITSRPCAVEEELHKKYKEKFGKLPKYVVHT